MTNLDAFHRSYADTVDALAQKLRPRFVTGRLTGYDERTDTDRTFRLEAICRKHPVAQCRRKARAVAAVSPSYEAAYRELFNAFAEPPRCANDAAGRLAAVCLKLDVLRVARGRRWIRTGASGRT
jgi:hypothetical protein